MLCGPRRNTSRATTIHRQVATTDVASAAMPTASQSGWYSRRQVPGEPLSVAIRWLRTCAREKPMTVTTRVTPNTVRAVRRSHAFIGWMVAAAASVAMAPRSGPGKAYADQAMLQSG